MLSKYNVVAIFIVFATMVIGYQYKMTPIAPNRLCRSFKGHLFRTSRTSYINKLSYNMVNSDESQEVIAPVVIPAQAISTPNQTISNNSSSTKKSSRKVEDKDISLSSTNRTTTSPKKSPTQRKSKVVDFSSFQLGQTFSAIISNVKHFGVFTTISSGHTIFLPRAKITTKQYHILQKLHENQYQLPIKVSITAISPEQKTLTGTPLSLETIDASQLISKNFVTLNTTDYTNKTMNGTVVGKTEFGIFVQLDNFLIDGLIPYSRISRRAGLIAERRIKMGQRLSVLVEKLDPTNSKLILQPAISLDENDDDDVLYPLPDNKWIVGSIAHVQSDALLIRPADTDRFDVLPAARIPDNVLELIQSRVYNITGRNSSDFRQLFHVGDIVKVRTETQKLFETGGKKTILTMLPPRSFYNPSSIDTHIKRPGEDKVYTIADYEEFQREINYYACLDASQIDPYTLLLWYNGTYFKDPHVKEEKVLLNMDDDRMDPYDMMFEHDVMRRGMIQRALQEELQHDAMMEDGGTEPDQELKNFRKEYKEFMDTGYPSDIQAGLIECDTFKPQIGSFIDPSFFPSDIQEQLSFYHEKEEEYTAKTAYLRQGSKADLAQVRAELIAAAGDFQAEAPKRMLKRSGFAIPELQYYPQGVKDLFETDILDQAMESGGKNAVDDVLKNAFNKKRSRD